MWHVLHNADDWEQYKKTAVPEAAGMDVTWPACPSLPCLATSRFVPAESRVLSAFVTVADAEFLLSAVRRPAPAAPAGPDPRSAEVRRDFDRSTAANVMAIVSELIRVGVTTADRYERVYAACLADADQMYACAETAAQAYVRREGGD